MMRYGNGFRANKVNLAHKNGAIEVILFSEPLNVAPKGTDPGKI